MERKRNLNSAHKSILIWMLFYLETDLTCYLKIVPHGKIFLQVYLTERILPFLMGFLQRYNTSKFI